MKGKSEARAESPPKELEGFAKKLAKAQCLRTGTIVFRLDGEVEREFSVVCYGKGSVRVVQDRPMDVPLLTVRGDESRLMAILRGEKDARMLFFAGEITLVGDLRYLSDFGTELGILDEPL